MVTMCGFHPAVATMCGYNPFVVSTLLCKSEMPIINCEPCCTDQGLLLGILGTWESYSKVVHLASEMWLGSHSSTEIKMS